jgi:hypothetical protein
MESVNWPIIRTARFVGGGVVRHFCVVYVVLGCCWWTAALPLVGLPSCSRLEFPAADDVEFF